MSMLKVNVSVKLFKVIIYTQYIYIVNKNCKTNSILLDRFEFYYFSSIIVFDEAYPSRLIHHIKPEKMNTI